MADAPMDPSKRQKYLERRLVLSERTITSVQQELNLYRVEKQAAVSDLQQKVQDLHQYKHDFNQKAEFLY